MAKKRKLRFFIALGLISAGIIFGLQWINSFLSLNAPVDADVLIVEGWLFEYMLDEVVAEIGRGPYTAILTAGTPFDKSPAENPGQSSFGSNAERTAARIVARGVDPRRVFAVTTTAKRLFQTYTMAKDCRAWLTQRSLPMKGINVYSGGPHGRKSFRTYKKVFEPDAKIGIFSARIRHYPANFWFFSFRGIAATMKNLAGYIYTFFL